MSWWWLIPAVLAGMTCGMVFRDPLMDAIEKLLTEEVPESEDR